MKSDDKRSGTIGLRVNAAERAAFEAAAEAAGLPLPHWMRERLRAEARRELSPLGLPVAFLPPASVAKVGPERIEAEVRRRRPAA